jgi:hypothetical protein
MQTSLGCVFSINFRPNTHRTATISVQIIAKMKQCCAWSSKACSSTDDGMPRSRDIGTRLAGNWPWAEYGRTRVLTNVYVFAPWEVDRVDYKEN